MYRKKSHVRIQQENGCLQAKARGLTGNQLCWYLETLDFLCLCSQCPALSMRACQRARRSGAAEKATFAASLEACSKHWFCWPVFGICFVLCCFPTGRLRYYALNCGVYYSKI